MTCKRILAMILTLLILLLTACVGYNDVPDTPRPPETQAQTHATEPTEQTSDSQTEAQTAEPQESTAPETEAPQEDEPSADLPVVYGEYYYDVANVVLYLYVYGELPPNYITKNEARDLGWTGGSVEKYREGAAIGGDYFGNYEGLLPSADGRRYTECDIDTDGYGSRGSRRLIFSNDGLYFYTSDHYESFSEVTITEDYEVIW